MNTHKMTPWFFTIFTTIGLIATTARADTFTWTGGDITNNWSEGGNWLGGAAPINGNSSGDQFTFDVNLRTSNVVNAYNFLNASTVTFTNPAAAFEISINDNQRLRLTGNGVQNFSGVTQTFRTIGGAANQATDGGALQVEASASTSGATIINQAGVFSNSFGGLTVFTDNSTAGTAAITNLGGADSNRLSGLTNFSGTASAGTSTITNAAGTGGFGGGGGLTFFGSSTAADSTINNSGGDTAVSGSFVTFQNTSTAGNASIANEGSSLAGVFSGPARVNFRHAATAGTSTIVTSGGRANSGALGGGVGFEGTSSAGAATLEMKGGSAAGALGARTEFFGSSTSGAATLQVRSGTNGGLGGDLRYSATADGGTARAVVEAGGTFDISGLSGTGMTIGSIEGAGTYSLGSKRLTVGSTNVDRTVGGILQDGGVSGGMGGGLTKVGAGKLILEGANTYTGSTSVFGGVLQVDGSLQSSTVNIEHGGTLGGIGNVQSIRLISGGTLAPGNSPGTLTASSLLWDTGGVIELELGFPADLLTVSGALTNNAAGAHAFRIIDSGIQIGQAYSLINFGTTNFSASDFSLTNSGPIAGNFAIVGNRVEFTASAVPEPSTYALMLAAAAGVFLLKRRRKPTTRGHEKSVTHHLRTHH